MPQVVVAISALVGAVAAVRQYSESKKARRAQEEQSNQQQAINTIESRRARQEAAREARIKRAQVAQAAESQGTVGSTTELGANSALAAGQSRQAGEQAFQTKAALGLSRTQQQIANAQANIMTAQAVGNLSSSIFNIAGGTNTLFSIGSA